MNSVNHCSGCGACASVCPTSAIRKDYDPAGWFRYIVDEEKCVNCSLCEKVCPSNCQPQELIHFNASSKYSAYAADPESVAKSSSGALAYEMGKFAIENGYRVVGTLYDYSENIARWAIAESVEELEKFRGSKYIQADTDPIFSQILKTEGKYLVIGTPCQIYGMRKAAERTKCKNELLFVDFVCHGVPSYAIWHAYLRECAEGKIRSVNFRDKTYGWHNIALKVDSEKGLSLEKRSKSSFFLAFDDGYFYNEQCYRCELNNGNGVSDIRIGDCWGEAFKNNQTGVSRVLIGTEKGRAFFESIRPSMHCADLEMHLPANNKRNFAAFKALRNTAIEKAQTAPDLKRVIKFYRSKLPLKTRVFCYLRNNKVFKALYALKSTSK